ncbi:MAG: hypothetical protein FJX76_14565 [Armatimonadetes bacterium]|nr:hypothetical protein [Armatimonadota bacterium]
MTFHPRDLTEQFLVEAWYVYQAVRYSYPLLPARISARLDDKNVCVRLTVTVTHGHSLICVFEARQYRRSARYNVRLYWEPTTFEEAALASARYADWPAMTVDEEINLAETTNRFRDRMMSALQRACGPPTRPFPERGNWSPF